MGKKLKRRGGENLPNYLSPTEISTSSLQVKSSKSTRRSPWITSIPVPWVAAGRMARVSALVLSKEPDTIPDQPGSARCSLPQQSTLLLLWLRVLPRATPATCTLIL